MRGDSDTTRGVGDPEGGASDTGRRKTRRELKAERRRGALLRDLARWYETRVGCDTDPAFAAKAKATAAELRAQAGPAPSARQRVTEASRG